MVLGGQWKALWASARQCRAIPPSHNVQTSDKKRAARVQTLGASGEEARALAAATSARIAPRTQATLDKVKDCFATAPSAAAAAAATSRTPPSEQLLEAVATHVRRVLKEHPKLTAPGMLGTRLEHLGLLGDDPWALDNMADVIACLALGLVPDDVMHALRAGEVVAFEKDDGAVRPLLVGSAIRRLGLKALMKVKKECVSDAVGPHQYGVGRKGGAELLIKKLEAQAEVRPGAAFIKADVKAAFQRLLRSKAFDAVTRKDAELGQVLKEWYEGTSSHLWRNAAGRFETVSSNEGFDQGCPLAGAAFSIALSEVLEPYLLELQGIDPLSRLYAYLDDIYLVVDAWLAPHALTRLREVLAPLGLELNPRKNLVWCPAGNGTLPVELAPYSVTALPVLGSHLRQHGDHDDDPHLLGQPSSALGVAAAKLNKLWSTLERLQKAGLKKQAAAALLRSYAGSASQHALRLKLATQEEAELYDQQLMACWKALAGRDLDSTNLAVLGLPARLGGVGAQFATDRRCTA